MATFVALLKQQNQESALNQLKFVILIGGVPPPLEDRPVDCFHLLAPCLPHRL